MRDRLFRALIKLKTQEQTVIDGRFFHDETLEELGVSMGVTRERIRQVETGALEKLRRWIDRPPRKRAVR